MSIESERFYSHLEHIYNIFGDSSSNELSSFHSIDAFVIVRGKFSDDIKESIQTKTSIFHDYIFNYDFTDTLIFFSPKKVYFFVASKKKGYIDATKKPSGIANAPEIQTILRIPSEDSTEKVKEILENVKKDVNKAEINIGYLKAEKGIGKVVEDFYSVAENLESIHLIDTPLLIDEIIQIKDKEELNLINISSKFSCYILSYLNKEFENDVDNEKAITHMEISSLVKKMYDKENFKKKFAEKNSKYKINPPYLEVKYSPVIQSGGHYTIDPFKVSDTNQLSEICSWERVVCRSSVERFVCIGYIVHHPDPWGGTLGAWTARKEEKSVESSPFVFRIHILARISFGNHYFCNRILFPGSTGVDPFRVKMVCYKKMIRPGSYPA